MNKLFASILLLLLFTFSCTSEASPDNGLSLFNDLIFNDNPEEVSQEITPESQTTYKQHFLHGELQIPLYRHLSHSKYDLFIGIPYRTSLADLKQDYFAVQDSVWTKLQAHVDSSSYHRTYQAGGYYLAEYAIETTEGSLIYLAAVGDTTRFDAATFATFDLTSRISTRE